MRDPSGGLDVRSHDFPNRMRTIVSFYAES